LGLGRATQKFKIRGLFAPVGEEKIMKVRDWVFLVMSFYFFMSVPVLAGEIKIYSSEGVQTITVPGEETDLKGNWVRQPDSIQSQIEKRTAVKGAHPLLKITPLENGKYLLEHMDSSFNNMDNLLVKTSKQLLGKSYRLGGNGLGKQGIDCSGFMKKIYQSLTLSLPHSSREQAKLGSLVTTECDLGRLKIGDLLFFKRNRGAQIGHTGMYVGDGKMIHSVSKKGVVISNLNGSDYYNRKFVMAKRLFILEDPQGDGFKDQ
jgi:hypothetical protein